MINYSKARESVEKTASKKSLARTNKSHTSSINIKLSQESTVDNIKIPMKNLFREKMELYPGGRTVHPQTQHKKYSVKLQSHEKENQPKRKEVQPYDVTIFRPFQETNRYLETERLPKEYKPQHERTPTKPALRLRTQHQDNKHIRTDYTDHTPQKYRKEPSIKHTTQSSNKIVRVPVEDVRRLMGQLLREKAEVSQLKKQLQFYREHAGEGNANPVMRSLRV